MGSYRQLDGEARELLEAAVERMGSVAAVARVLGYGRSSISLALAGKYIGDTGKIRIAIFERLRGSVDCPHLGMELTAGDCASFRERGIPTSSPAQIKHWQACQMCKYNPYRMQEAWRDEVSTGKQENTAWRDEVSTGNERMEVA